MKNIVGDLFSYIKGEKPEPKMREGKVPEVGKDDEATAMKKLQEKKLTKEDITPELVAQLQEQYPDVCGSADPEEIRKGLEIELEHGTVNPVTDITGDDLLMTLKITMAHISEIKDYNTRLLAMEEEAKEKEVPEEEPIEKAEESKVKEILIQPPKGNSQKETKEIYQHLVKEENAAVTNKRSGEWLEGFGNALNIVRSYIVGDPYESKVKEQVSGIPPKLLNRPAGKDEDVTIIARGISDKSIADEIARSKKGQILQDVNDPKKFMVVAMKEAKGSAAEHNQRKYDVFITSSRKPGLEKHLVDKLGIDLSFAKQLIRSYELKTAVNDESVDVIDAYLNAGQNESKVVEGTCPRYDRDSSQEELNAAYEFLDNSFPTLNSVEEKDKATAMMQEIESILQMQERDKELGESKLAELAEKLLLVEHIKGKEKLTEKEKKFIEETAKIQLSDKEREKVFEAYKRLKKKVCKS